MTTPISAGRRSCPHCHYPLLPVHTVEAERRRVLCFTCPEPYCDYAEMAPGEGARPVRLRAAAQRPPLVERP